MGRDANPYISSLDGAKIEVLNWIKYNPRFDSKRPTWFRLENTIATGSTFFGLDCEQKWLWIFILSLVSQKRGSTIVWSTQYCTHLTGLSAEKQDKTIEIFERMDLLRMTRTVTVRDLPATNVRYETVRTNELLSVDPEPKLFEKEKIVKQTFSFEEIYQEYPRKQGKTDGIRVLKATIRTPEDFEAFRQAVRRYRENCIQEGREKGYIQHFSTFVGTKHNPRWREWLDPQTGTGIAGGSLGHIDFSKLKKTKEDIPDDTP